MTSAKPLTVGSPPLPPASEGWGRYSFHRCLSVCSHPAGVCQYQVLSQVSSIKSFHGGGGRNSSPGQRGNPSPVQAMGVLQDRGTLKPGQNLGNPTRTGLGYPPDRTGLGYPLGQDRTGVPPSQDRTGISSLQTGLG